MIKIHTPKNQFLEEFRIHQKNILPITRKYIGKKNLDIGCGNGLTSLIHSHELGVEPVLCDVIDIRSNEVRNFEFHLLTKEGLPFTDNSFNSSYIQYILHHINGHENVVKLLKEAVRVSNTIVIVEEIASEKTDMPTALAFDSCVNNQIHPNIPMHVFYYFTEKEMKDVLHQIGIPLIYHEIISHGSEENGFLETHVFVAQKINI
jgi:ubiquinone/menaquinone biosynthesis C-methylase UbiE